MKLSTLLLLLALLPSSLVSADDWPQFRGPKRDGVSTAKNLLKEWPDDKGPPVAWKATGVGTGFSSVAIVGDKIVTMGDGKDGSCYLYCVSRKDGSNLWEAKVGKGGGGGGYPGPRCTPTIDGDLVYGLGQHGELVCVKLADGKEVWRIDYKADYKGSSGGWQFSESPLIDGERLVCTPGGNVATMLVVEKKTGKKIWAGKTPNGEAAGYSSVMISNAGGVKQYVTLTSKAVVSFKAEDGSLLWQFGNKGDRFADNTANIPTVVLTDSADSIFASAGYGRGAALISIKTDSGKLVADEVYWNDKLKNKHGGIIRVGDYIYGDFDDSGRIWCAEVATGKVQWTRKDNDKGGGSASLTYADGKLYVRFQNGHVSLIDANPKEYKRISTFKLENGNGNCWAHPVVVDGMFYLREKDIIWCFNVKAKK